MALGLPPWGAMADLFRTRSWFPPCTEDLTASQKSREVFVHRTSSRISGSSIAKQRSPVWLDSDGRR